MHPNSEQKLKKTKEMIVMTGFAKSFNLIRITTRRVIQMTFVKQNANPWPSSEGSLAYELEPSKIGFGPANILEQAFQQAWTEGLLRMIVNRSLASVRMLKDEYRAFGTSTLPAITCERTDQFIGSQVLQLIPNGA